MITKEMKDRIYHVYRVSYCEAVAEVMNGKSISEATQEESLKILDILCNKMQSSNELFSESVFQEFILDKLIEGCAEEA